MHRFSTEVLIHFQCDACRLWWTVGDAFLDKKVHPKKWTCPWCGHNDLAVKMEGVPGNADEPDR